MALAALCGDDDWGQTWARVLQHRFRSAGEMHDHAVGNLLIVALWELLGGHVEGLDWVGRLLGAEGRVLPMSVAPIDITAAGRGARRPTTPGRPTLVRGQVEVASTSGRVRSVELLPARPAGLSRGARRGARRRLGGARPGLVVHQRDPAPARPRAAHRADRHLGPHAGHPQPGAADGGDRGLLARDAPRGAGRARARPRLDVVLADPGRSPTTTRCARWRRGSAPSWSSRTWPSTTAPRVTIRPSWRMPMRGS